MSKVTTLVLDLDTNKSARGMNVLLEVFSHEGWQHLSQGVTDSGGQIEELLITDSPLAHGVYRVSFDTKSYLESINKQALYPYVPVVFEVSDSQDTFEISIMLGASGYSSNIESTCSRS